MKFSLTFRSKLVSLLVFFSVIPTAAMLFYLIYSQSEDLEKKTAFHQQSNNVMISEVFDSFYYRNLTMLSDSLRGLRFKLRMVGNAIISANNSKDNKEIRSGTESIIRNIMFESTRSAGVMVIIYDKEDPVKSVYVRPEFRKLLKAKNVFHEEIKNFLSTTRFDSKGSYHVITDKDDGMVYLGLVMPMGNRVMLIAESVTELRTNFENENNRIIDNAVLLMKNTEEFMSNKGMKTYILDKHGSQIIPRVDDNYDSTVMYIPRNVLEEAKKNLSLSYDGIVNNDLKRMQIAYYKPMDCFIVSATSKKMIFSSQINLSVELLVLGFITSVLAFILAYLLISSLVSPLQSLNSRTGSLKYLKLTDKNQVQKFVDFINVSSEREVSEISKAICKMTESLSNNTIKLISSQNRSRMIEGELNVAKEIQLGVVGNQFDDSAFAPLDVYARLLPAKEVGGDLYDIIPLGDDKVAITIGDVSDKGVPAALFMVMTLTLIREGISLGMDMKKLICEVNGSLAKYNPNMMFVTLFVGILDKKTGRISFANCGHCKPVIVSAEGLRVIEDISGPAIGVLETYQYVAYECEIHDGERLFMFTDGVSEAHNSDRSVIFGEERIYDYLKSSYHKNVKDCINDLYCVLDEFKGNATQFDDITVLALDYRKS